MTAIIRRPDLGRPTTTTTPTPDVRRVRDWTSARTCRDAMARVDANPGPPRAVLVAAVLTLGAAVIATQLAIVATLAATEPPHAAEWAPAALTVDAGPAARTGDV